ncbi:MAG: hypothetical protein GDA43_11895 [Hormoscilla sp. SP5CHS1]|nr:hypothetical protein [Hormoscilla sp. SP12CHS1]MBC6453819.1 hypothetical protein [Hormoscilla sp. SP5CHS1]MBC6475006.1 hypothetical protein [Hormoscilla sp. GM102CHS1]MBO1350818.1 hypothetical protein [Hormoscilla sp. GUM202]
MTDSDTTCTLISLILPPSCQVERVLGNTYRITCPDPGTGRGVWEKRHSIYPLLHPGDILEVIAEEYHVRSHPRS